MEKERAEEPKVEAPPEGPGSELRGEPVVGDAAPSRWRGNGAKPGTGEREVPRETPQEGDADVQEQPPRPPTKEDEGVRGRPGQQAGS